MSGNESPIRKLWEARPLARHSHICSCCGHPIAIGTQYDRVVIVDKSQKVQTRIVLKLHHPLCPAEMLP